MPIQPPNTASSNHVQTLAEALRDAAARIPRREAETLLAHALGRDRTWLLAHGDDRLTPAEQTIFSEKIAQRAAGRPVQYITGTQEFFGLPLRVTPAVLIPRPETEHLVEAALAWAATQPQPLRVLDIGTGSGAIAIAVAHTLTQRGIAVTVTATDISPAALEVARANAAMHKTPIRFIESDLLGALPSETFDAILANPPYIAPEDAPTLAAEVRDHEPHTALFAADSGLAVYRRLIPQAHAALRPGGLLGLEIGFGQRDAVLALLQDWHEPHALPDYAGIPRVILATRR